MFEPTFKPISIIVATDLNGGIGKENSIVWKNKEDTQLFRKITTETVESSKMNAVIMGRNTWESLPPNHKPLKKRMNIVVSTKVFDRENENNPMFFSSIEDSLIHCQQDDRIESIFIIGGEKIYDYCLKHFSIFPFLINKIYWTIIFENHDCDCFFRPPDDFPIELFEETILLQTDAMICKLFNLKKSIKNWGYL